MKIFPKPAVTIVIYNSNKIVSILFLSVLPWTFDQLYSTRDALFQALFEFLILLGNQVTPGSREPCGVYYAYTD
jgi:hypothetical protein